MSRVRLNREGVLEKDVYFGTAEPERAAVTMPTA
jgi:hypothetical protein